MPFPRHAGTARLSTINPVDFDFPCRRVSGQGSGHQDVCTMNSGRKKIILGAVPGAKPALSPMHGGRNLPCLRVLTLGNLATVTPKLPCSLIPLLRFSIFLLFWVWQWWGQPQPDLLYALLIALLFYGTLEAIFWICRLLLAFVSHIVFRRHSLNLSTPMLQVRMTLLMFIALCGLPTASAPTCTTS